MKDTLKTALLVTYGVFLFVCLEHVILFKSWGTLETMCSTLEGKRK